MLDKDGILTTLGGQEKPASQNSDPTVRFAHQLRLEITPSRGELGVAL
jgi:hypothetical protein